ncbi:hypothetical protein AVEN_194025-1 [Araneus ventricosus]|uniref:Uncharacterized protein n=1 Tax=Araneus ventricosus TaxID=182803 RepID=A0A4Y2VHY0_ARAVE|nr:hypothetical protein AVEN_194025-1 [Araneus ventricosus]
MPTWPAYSAPAYRIAGSNPRQDELEVSSHSTSYKHPFSTTGKLVSGNKNPLTYPEISPSTYSWCPLVGLPAWDKEEGGGIGYVESCMPVPDGSPVLSMGKHLNPFQLDIIPLQQKSFSIWAYLVRV